MNGNTTQISEFISDCNRQVNNGYVFEIEDDSVSKALSIVKKLGVSSDSDVLMYLCSLNLLNAAIKTPKFKNALSYAVIKSNAAKLIGIIDSLKKNTICYFYNKDERCLYFQIQNVIFSFHEVPQTPEILKAAFSKPIVWSGVRLQKIAQPLFDKVIVQYSETNDTFSDIHAKDNNITSRIKENNYMSKNSTVYSTIINECNIEEIIITVFNALPSMPGWYRDYDELKRLVISRLISDGIELDERKLNSVLTSMGAIIKNDYIDQLTGKQYRAIKIQTKSQTFLSDKEKDDIRQIVISVIKAHTTLADSEGWFDLVLLAPYLTNAGIDKKKYGVSKLHSLLILALGDQMESRVEGTQVFLKFNFETKENTNSNVDNIEGNHHDYMKEEYIMEECSKSDMSSIIYSDESMLSGIRIGEHLELSSYGVLLNGQIKSLEKDYIELVLDNKKTARVKCAAISTIVYDKALNDIRSMSQLNDDLRNLLEQAAVKLDSAIITNATITMTDAKRVWFTTDDGTTIGCFKGNIIGYDQNKMNKGQRIFTFPAKKETAYSIIVEMTYREFINNFHNLTSSLNKKNFVHKRMHSLVSITYLIKQFNNNEIYSGLKSLKLSLKKQFKEIAKTMLELHDGDDSDIELGYSQQDTNSTSAEVAPDDSAKSNQSTHDGADEVVEHKTMDGSVSPALNVTSTSDSEIFKPEVISIPGPKILGQIDLTKIKDKRKGNKPEERTISLNNLPLPYYKEDDVELMPTNGILISIGPNFGWIKQDSSDSPNLFVPANEIISYYGLLDAPTSGERVTFSLGKNYKGPIAICVHKECSRDVVEQLIDKIGNYDKVTAYKLQNQLVEQDSLVLDDTKRLKTQNEFDRYLSKAGISATDTVNPDEAEISFSSKLTPEEYVIAVQMLIGRVLAINPSKSYNLFLRSSSYARSHGMIDEAKNFISQAIKVFRKDEKKVKYFNSLMKSINELGRRIPINRDSLNDAIKISERQFGSIPKYVTNSILSNNEFKGIIVDKETVRSGLYKEEYIDEVRKAVLDNPSDDAIYLTLIKLELSFRANKYNPLNDYIKFLTNRAKNIISSGKNAKYDEARYLLRLSFSKRTFVRGIDDSLPLYLLTIGGYSFAEIDLYMRGNEEKYKFDELLKRAISLNTEESKIELAYLSLSNPYISERIIRACMDIKYDYSCISAICGKIRNLDGYIQEFNLDPLRKYSTISNGIRTSQIALGVEREVINEDSVKLISKMTEYITGSKYSVLKNYYAECVRLIDGIKTKLNSNTTMLGLEYIFPVVDKLQQDLKSNFSMIEQRVNPKISIDIIDEAIRVAESDAYDLNIIIRNNGDSARDVTIRSIKAIGADLNEGNELTIDATLSAGEEKSVTLNVIIGEDSITEGVAEANFSLTFEDIYVSTGQTINRAIDFTRKIIIRKESFSEISNPYKIPSGGNELGGTDSMFYGRDDLLNELEDLVLTSWNSQIAIYGQKRTGKSSLLNRLKSNLDRMDNVVCIKFSLQKYSPETVASQKLNGFEAWIMRQIADGITKNKKVRQCILKGEADAYFNANPDSVSAIEQFILHFREKPELKEYHIVVMMDEFTALYQSIKDGQSDKNFMRRWKALVETPELKLQSVIVAQDTLPLFMNEEYAANGFGIFNLKLLTYLSKEETLRLITDPVKEIKFHGHSDEIIYDYTAGSPMFTQKFCSSLVDILNERKTYSVTKEEIEIVIDLLCRGTKRLEKSTFECLVNEADGSDYNSADNEKILKLLALQTRAGGSCRAEDLGSSLPISKTRDILEHLLSRRVLSKSQDGGYSINVKLFRQWMLNQ